MSKSVQKSPQNESEDKDLVASGEWGEVRHAIRSNGRMEAKDWIDQASVEESSKFDHLFRKMASHGAIRNKEHFRLLNDGIWEFKRDGNSVLCFQVGKCWFLTHHYPKSGKKCPPPQIEHAKIIRSEVLSREGNSHV